LLPIKRIDPTNLGPLDRAVRTLLGLCLVIYAVVDSWAYSWIGLFGFVPVVTAILGWCPVYTMLKLSTAEDRNASEAASSSTSSSNREGPGG